MGKVTEYKSAAITVKFEGARCIHSRHCVLGLPDAFIANAPGDWIQPEAASADDIARIAHACPSGAITYERHDGVMQEGPPKVNTIRLQEAGPLVVRADLRIGGSTVYRATLCRCGASKNKPFCDNSHLEANFSATCEPPAADAGPALETRDGPLEATPKPDGPLYLKGNVEICCGSGRTLRRAGEVWLCRCGGSQTKPFCDGTHKKNGFKG